MIQGVNAVDGAQVGRPDVVHFVIVDPLHTGSVAVHADVGVGVHKTGVDLEIGDVDDLIAGKVPADGCDLTVFQQEVCFIGRLMDGIMDDSILYDCFHDSSLLFDCDEVSLPP